MTSVRDAGAWTSRKRACSLNSYSRDLVVLLYLMDGWVHEAIKGELDFLDFLQGCLLTANDTVTVGKSQNVLPVWLAMMKTAVCR